MIELSDNLTRCLGLFQVYMKKERFSNRSYVEFYNIVRMFFEWLKGESGIDYVDDVDLRIMKDYHYHISTRPKVSRAKHKKTEPGLLSHNTIRKYLQALNTFFKFMYNEEEIVENPMEKIVIPERIKRYDFRVLSFEEIKKIIKALDFEIFSPLAQRDRAMVILNYAIGDRSEELRESCKEDAHIWFEDNKWKGKFKLARPKNKVKKWVPIADLAAQALNDYINFGREKLLWKAGIQTDKLFITEAGKTLNCGNYNWVIRKWAKKAELHDPASISSHTFRRSIGTELLDRGVPLQDVAALLNHLSIKTTQEFYNYTSHEKLRREIEEFHPLSKKDKDEKDKNNGVA